MTHSPALTVVMPVYNEAAAIGDVVRAWAKELDRLGIDYEMRVYDDGSRDATATVLEELSHEVPRLLVTRHSNRGHGPTILRGYREARGEWVFQSDSDGEMEPDSFSLLWDRRADYDFLFGIRGGREWTPPRWVMTRASRLAVRMLFGKGVLDVNTPYRLMRRERLARAHRAAARRSVRSQRDPLGARRAQSPAHLPDRSAAPGPAHRHGFARRRAQADQAGDQVAATDHGDRARQDDRAAAAGSAESRA